MPSVTKKASVTNKTTFDVGPFASTDVDSNFEEQELRPKISKKQRKKERHAAVQHQPDHGSSTAPEEDLTGAGLPAPPPPPHAAASSLLSQLSHGFPRSRTDAIPVDRNQVNAGEKVSDQYTPPNDEWLEDMPNDRHNAEQPDAAGKLLRSRDVPVAEPGFSKRNAFQVRSPPTSPPQRYGRLVSHGRSIPPPTNARQSFSSYSRASGAYGSPPALHHAQSPFHQAQDVDLGLPRYIDDPLVADPSLVKYTAVRAEDGAVRQGALVSHGGRLDVLCLIKSRFEMIGGLSGMRGRIIDALLLPEGFLPELHRGFFPVVALVVHSSDQPATEDNNYGHGIVNRINVQIYSLATHQQLLTLLEIRPPETQPIYRGQIENPGAFGSLKLYASEQCLVVASGISGEVWVFTLLPSSNLQIECIAKFWSNLQPQFHRRDSSHGQVADSDVSPADLNRGTNRVKRAIIDVSGRWLAISPASTSSNTAIGAELDAAVLQRKHAGIDLLSPPARPVLSCEVESPDADSLLGKVARNVAQEVVKGARWLGDQGYNVWQTYWQKEASSFPTPQPIHSPPLFPKQYAGNTFPPTHADMMQAPKEPDLVSIIDLQQLRNGTGPRYAEATRPFATFQPPHGCSFVSFSPHGLRLFTAGRKGDVQYVWDLLQAKYRHFNPAQGDEHVQSVSCVRQIARYERMSESSIVDVAWDGTEGSRFAILTRNRTLHILDLSDSAARWPPLRHTRTNRSDTKSMDAASPAKFVESSSSSGFFASAMNMASKAQPVVASWRGRAPGMGTGITSIGQTSIGLASATGKRSGRAVAAGLSKSLGAASDTVSHMRHAGESRLHLKSNRAVEAGRLYWGHGRGRISMLYLLDPSCLNAYRVGCSKIERRRRDQASVFDARRAIEIKLPKLHQHPNNPISSNALAQAGVDDLNPDLKGFWYLQSCAPVLPQPMEHPLALAEIETCAPYQPFHADRRVTLSVVTAQSSKLDSDTVRKTKKPPAPWAFGDVLVTTNINASIYPTINDINHEPVIYRETVVSTPEDKANDMRYVTSTTRRRKNRPVTSITDTTHQQGDFFDDLEALEPMADKI